MVGRATERGAVSRSRMVCSQAMADWKVSGRQWLEGRLKNEIRVKAAPAGETVA